MSERNEPAPQMNFEAAQMYMDAARQAYAAGDLRLAQANCKMIWVALSMNDDGSPIFHLGHLGR